ncbi:MAG: methyltransferase [Thermoplasmata archaeon]|nr:methyltransferase [Thermoplasmata archaeon]MCI4354339.1 methyltransferase [Thermoplasmata archaeon]
MLEQHTKASAGTGAPVYPPREDTELLRPFATGAAGSWLVDVGTGNGALALAAARAGMRVVATDRNPAALGILARRARAEGLPILAVRTDLTRGIRPVDRLVCNPPYLPTPRGGEDPDPWADLALNGGPDGCRVTAPLVRSLRAILRPDGRAFVLVSSLQSRERMQALRARFVGASGEVRVVAERALEGERLEVWEWVPGAKPLRRAAPRTGRPLRGTGARRRVLRRRHLGSSPGPARG